ncbi:BatA domain-containing protein [Aeoliella sp.]|uniref:BatA domain-containing protein n=1 Tax=Aeoliella sp. TaxID=2795800 RepID=UPI003CCBD42C
MSFLSPLLLAGTALIALPIVLHLVMRREPKKVEFPALRFVRKRQSTNQTRLRLRHWILLALRCAFILFLALALARPVLRGSGLLGSGSAGLAAAVVIDNSPRMEYLQKNVSRLDAAKETANWLLEQLPADSEVALVEPGRARRAKLGERDSAILRTERLRITPAAAPLADAVIEAINLLAERPDHRREVYVFTDLSRVVWNDAAFNQIAEALDANEGTKLYLVDVGEKDPVNAGLGELELSADHLATGEIVTLRTNALATENLSGRPRSVEVWLAPAGEKPTKRAEVEVELSDTAQTVEAPLAGLTAGVHQGYVRLSGDDPLSADNARYFTVSVDPPPRVLLVGATLDHTKLMAEALAPSALSQTAAAQYAVEQIAVDGLDRAQLATYDAVMLLDPPALSAAEWRKLSDFVQTGGGLAVVLGRNAVGNLDKFNTPAARPLLQGELRWVDGKTTYLSPAGYGHPVLRQLSDIAEATPWPAFPVFKKWAVSNLDEATRLVATFADGTPAIIQGLFGSGRVLLVTTPLSDRASDEPWNLLPTNPDPWPFLALAEGMADYLVGADNRPLNYQAGRVVSLPLPRRSDLATYVLEPPTGDPLPQSLSPGQQEIVVTVTDQVGNYRVRSGGERARLDRGFSVNSAADVGMLQRAEFATIAAALGKDRVELATNRRSLSGTIDLGRVGRELFPWLIAIVAVVLACEQWLADRFYKSE